MSPKEFAFILPTLSMGGAERFISEMSQYLSQQKLPHHIIINENIVDYTIGRTTKLHILFNNNVLRNIPKIRFIYCLYRLFKIIKKNEIKILYCGMDSCAKLLIHLKRFVIPSIKIVPRIQIRFFILYYLFTI